MDFVVVAVVSATDTWPLLCLGNVDTVKCSPHGVRSKFYWFLFFVDRPHSFGLFSLSSCGDLLIMKGRIVRRDSR